MAQSKKSPAKTASKSAEPRKADKAVHAKKQVPRTAAPKSAKPAAAKVAAAKTAATAIKTKSTKPAAAKAQVKGKAETPAKTQVKAKSEVTSTKKTAAPARPSQTKTAAAKPAPTKAPAKAAAKVAQATPAPAAAKPAAKTAAAAKAPVAGKVTVPTDKGLAAAIAARAKAAAAPTARAMPAAVHKSAARMTTAPSMPVLPAQPTLPRAAVVTPKEVALKAAEASRQQALAPKKPVNSRNGFKIGESIVYPAHGVGQIVGIEEQEIAGMTLELFVIQIEKDKLTLRVPTSKLEQAGVRKLAEDNIVSRAMETLKGRARITRTRWSRRAQEYEAKINSGDLVAIAEVVRDLYRSDTQPEQSYSERQLYESALDRMAREIAVVDKLDERTAMQRITEVLSRSARGRRASEETAGDTQAA